MAVSKRIQRAQRASKLLGIAIASTLLLGLGSLYLPWSMTQAAQEQLHHKQQELQQAQQAASQLRQTVEQLRATQLELQFLERGVSEAAYVPTMLKQFEQTALQRKLQIVSIRPQVDNSAQSPKSDAQKSVQKAYHEQLFEIQLRGKFWDLMSLLKTLETFPKILAVQSLNAQAKSGMEQSTENPDLEIKMIVKAFIFRPAQARPGTTATQTGG
ncbi:MAG: type 4a pilus biogenesis protein PilO [Fimbriimonadales bacterium]|nr:type 4a pilus biogenesis protein PilO [Fimbriimonadales bacterium]